MSKKVSSAERAARSGFRAKLALWYSDNRRMRAGVISSSELARRLTERGEPIDQTTVSRWERGESLPNGRYIGHIERLMGAPWAYLDDPDTPWPRPFDDAALRDLIQLLSPNQLKDWINRMQEEVQRRSSR